jgi:hypothetical protein
LDDTGKKQQRSDHEPLHHNLANEHRAIVFMRSNPSRYIEY